MSTLLRAFIVVGLSFFFIAAPLEANAQELNIQSERERLAAAYKAGNYRDAYEGYKQLLLAEKSPSDDAPSDLALACYCLSPLGRIEELDDLLEAVITKYGDDWELLTKAGEIYHQTTHSGFLVGGKFYRGSHRGGGRYVSSEQRDRIRALQLLIRAIELSKNARNTRGVANTYAVLASVLSRNENAQQAWKLQQLTDLAKLPDFEEETYSYGYSSGAHGAPVNPDGRPVMYQIPKSFESAANDGERYRFAQSQEVELDPSTHDKVTYYFAQFLRNQFDVQTLASYGFYRTPKDDDQQKDESGTYAIHTLREDETIARLANGIKRFKLPDEFNFIRMFKELADSQSQPSKSSYADSATNTLAEIFENRRQFDKAAEYWRRSIRFHGPGQESSTQKRLDQIVGAWGQFEPKATQPAGKEATVEYLFRNGKSVTLEAREINVEKLLSDVRSYLQSNPRELNHQQIDLSNIGYRLIEKNENQYLGKIVASWKQDLTPKENHFDSRITIKTPLEKAGTYLLSAQVAGGNKSNLVLWLSDTTILKKPLKDGAYYYVADALSGKPVADAKVHFFGFKRAQNKPSASPSQGVGRLFEIITIESFSTSDRLGQVLRSEAAMDSSYQWLVTANTSDGRTAYLGFSSVWYSRSYNDIYNQTKAFVITDRPVYRPGQTVKFKVWVRNTRYEDTPDALPENTDLSVQINNPKGEKVFEQTLKADRFGGIQGEFLLPKEAALGPYALGAPNYGLTGSFRVEEYKKPEFEVSVETPKKPKQLGDKITAQVKAKYYFGAPVTEAKVRYKVLRSSQSAQWYPVGIWDWLYGRGYWWFAYDYNWFPGWGLWGCKRPMPPWWGGSHEPPEVIQESEVVIGPDGSIKIEIDTKPAQELHGDVDHRYVITAEVVDQSRRTIVSTGEVLVARKPFRVYAWVDRGYYETGQTVQADFSAQTIDNKPIQGNGHLKLYRITYEQAEPKESIVEEWSLKTNEEGKANLQFKAASPGQYRLSLIVTDRFGHSIEGGYLFSVVGAGENSSSYRFNEIELIPDKREYAPGEKVRLMINTNYPGSTVLLFVRPVNGVYFAPELLSLEGKSTVKEILISKEDMPNFFVEAVTINNGRLYSETREIVVPPEKKILNVELLPSATEYRPGESAKVEIRLTDPQGKPFIGSAVLSVYDRSVEYISGGSNVAEMKSFFWGWRRRHQPALETTLWRIEQNIVRSGEEVMRAIGVFGETVVDELEGDMNMGLPKRRAGFGGLLQKEKGDSRQFAEGFAAEDKVSSGKLSLNAVLAPSVSSSEIPAQSLVQPTIRKEFADTAYWNSELITADNGRVVVTFQMPENLTEWKVKLWALGVGTSVGEGDAKIVTTKKLVLRMQAPRFFIERDEVVLSANIHNYLKTKKAVNAKLELIGDTLAPLGETMQSQVEIEPSGEKRVDWRVKAAHEGSAVVRMLALTDEESDAVEMRFPVYVHGMLKTDSYSGAITSNENHAKITLQIPEKRRVDQSRLEIRYSPTLAGAMVDALPYLVSYPYGCTEQTLNRFLPTVITQQVLKSAGVKLSDIKEKRTNLNAQEIGDDKERAKQWKRFEQNPVFDEDEVATMTKAGVERLKAMQLADGGWGWFSGSSETSSPHTTAYVVHGLQLAKDLNVLGANDALERGVSWLKNYQAGELQKLKNAPTETKPYKNNADDLDVFVYMVLVENGALDADMREYIYRDRNSLSLYSKSMFGIALEREQQSEKLSMILKNLDQYLIQDNENQTAYLRMPQDNHWWYWYGSEYEAQSYYLKLLSRTAPQSKVPSRLVKYLLNNRKHATYWNSTRDTAIVVEAFAEYLKASGEDKPELTLQIIVDGKKQKEVSISPENLFTFDNKLVLLGDVLRPGEYSVEMKKKGKSPLYFNAYLTNFTLEDPIAKSGLEIKVERKYYKLIREDAKSLVQGERGQAIDQKVEKYRREPLSHQSALKSGDLVEVELEIESKNDYEYIVFEDMKAAGFEPVEIRSGYNNNDLGAYVEFRDERVNFFARTLARGKHSISYRVRAEIPGRFSALPTKAYAMYAPELKANSDEFRVTVQVIQ